MLAALARDMASYNRWMNERLYEACARLTDSDRKRDCGAFFRSVHGTLNHLLLGDKIWLGRFLGNPIQVRNLDEELHAEFEALRRDRVGTDEVIVRWTDSLTDAALAGELRYVSVASPAPRKYEMWLAVAHFFNHQTHHRGQLTTLLSQFGQDMGVTDLIGLPEVVRRNAT
ncbi:MAG TPA: DinB family protein [Povalibacter sp.]|uniref:DinB family protein n=1 Tax=Povalibacter sp. TaxID=1962978 RepID=UPI002BDC645B|nr:DinB family protein [Povalibacter sp.]HMN46481.1 DinB family protein [Povalibacter sp.]